MNVSEQANPSTVSVTYTVTADDLVAMSRMTERDARPLIHIITAVVLGIGFFIAVSLNPRAGAAVIGLGVALGILSVTPAFWRFWLTRQSGRLIGEQRSFTFDASGIHEGPPAIGYTTPWTAFSVMRITAEGVFLLTDGIVVQMLPIRAFATPYDVDRLIGLVSARASNVSIA